MEKCDVCGLKPDIFQYFSYLQSNYCKSSGDSCPVNYNKNSNRPLLL